MRVYLLLMAVAFVVTAAITPAVAAIGRKAMANVQVRDRDVHKDRIPKLGGVGIIAGIAVALLVATRPPFLEGVFANPRLLIGLGFSLAIILVVGVLDDLYDLRWYVKFAGQAGVGLVMALSGVKLEVLPVGWIKIESEGWQIGLAVFLMVLTMNAINFVDGLDGLAAGMAAIGAIAFFLYCYLLARDVNQFDHANLGAMLMAILVGATLGFLVHNFYPAKIFMGESGAMVIGLMMAVAAIAVTADVRALEGFRFRNVPAYMPILLPAAVILLPMIDLLFSVVRRTARGKSPFSADRGHLHHKLIDGGYTHRGAVLLLYVWSAIFAVGTLALNWVSPAILFPLWGVALLGAILLTIRPWIDRKVTTHRVAKAREAAMKRRTER